MNLEEFGKFKLAQVDSTNSNSTPQDNESTQQLMILVQNLNELNTRLVEEKCVLLQTSCQTIDHLREHIKTLSVRLNSV